MLLTSICAASSSTKRWRSSMSTSLSQLSSLSSTKSAACFLMYCNAPQRTARVRSAIQIQTLCNAYGISPSCEYSRWDRVDEISVVVAEFLSFQRGEHLPEVVQLTTALEVVNTQNQGKLHDYFHFLWLFASIYWHGNLLKPFLFGIFRSPPVPSRVCKLSLQCVTLRFRV